MSCAELPALVGALRYRPGWSFRLHAGATSASWTCGPPAPVSSGGWAAWGEPLFLVVCAAVEDSAAPGRPLRVEHRFAVPPDQPPAGWRRWLLDRCLDVDRHEAMEWFAIGGDRPFYPGHGPGADLYGITEPITP